MPTDPTPFRQNDPRWGATIVGAGAAGDTFGKLGCMVTCLCIARNALLDPPELDPLAINKTVKDANGFLGKLLILETGAAALSLAAPDASRLRSTMQNRDNDRLKALVKSTVEAGGVALLHVDHDSASSTKADPEGDHFVLAFKLENGELHCADPAPGKIIEIDADTLAGTSPWGKTTKSYTVVGVAPITKA